MRISFKINKEYDTELIQQLEKFKEKNLSQIIRKILRDNLVYRKNEIEDVFAEDTITNDINNTNTNETLASNTDNVEVRQINRKTEINNNNTNNKSKSIKWNIPK